MGVKVKLADIVDAMELRFEGFYQFLYKKTGQVISITSEELSEAEELPEDVCPEDLDEGIAQALDYYENDQDYVALPEDHEIDEYEIMQNFCFSISPEQGQKQLLRAIDGRGAFRRFKDLIYELEIADEWYQFCEAAYVEIARQWCEDNDLAYEE